MASSPLPISNRPTAPSSTSAGSSRGRRVPAICSASDRRCSSSRSSEDHQRRCDRRAWRTRGVEEVIKRRIDPTDVDWLTSGTMEFRAQVAAAGAAPPQDAASHLGNAGRRPRPADARRGGARNHLRGHRGRPCALWSCGWRVRRRALSKSRRRGCGFDRRRVHVQPDAGRRDHHQGRLDVRAGREHATSASPAATASSARGSGPSCACRCGRPTRSRRDATSTARPGRASSATRTWSSSPRSATTPASRCTECG